MTDDSLEQPESSRETQEASAEAAERLMRLKVWLDGLLAGGPSLADAVKPWREGLPIYDRPAGTFAEDQNEVPEDGLWKAWENDKTVFPPFPQPLEIAAAIPALPPPRRRA